MEAKTPASKRKGDLQNKLGKSSHPKSRKSGSKSDSEGASVTPQLLSRSPKVNKTPKVKSKVVKPTTPKKGATRTQCSRNNNATLAKEPGQVYPDENQTQEGLNLSNLPDPEDQDHVCIGVTDSEDEFMEENPLDDDQDESFNHDSGSDYDQNNTDSDESEVVISEKTKRVWKQQEAEQVSKVANHPDMLKYVQNLVGQQVKAALSDPKLAAKIIADVTKNKTGKNKVREQFVKRVIKNVKSPSDTTIYAPALNLTPEKQDRVQPRDRIPAVVTDKGIAEFIHNIRINNDNTSVSPSHPIDPQPDAEPQPGPSG